MNVLAGGVVGAAVKPIVAKLPAVACTACEAAEPRRHDPSRATPLKSVVWVVPVNRPSPRPRVNTTLVPATGLPEASLTRTAGGGLMKFPNVMLPDGPMQYAEVGAALADAAVSWQDFAWIRKVWDGPIVVKGVLTAEDTRRSIDEGAVAVVVSNHGGRQLDCVSSTLRALPEVLAAANGRVEVLLDGGIRRGGDIVKALCLGARAVLIGRAYAYGLGADGQAGVARAIAILRADVERTLKLLGCPSVAQLDRSYVDIPFTW